MRRSDEDGLFGLLEPEGGGRAGSGCPEPDDLVLVASGEDAPQALRLRVLDHAISCDACAHELLLARRLHEAIVPEVAARAGARAASPFAALWQALTRGALWQQQRGPVLVFAALVLVAVTALAVRQVTFVEHDEVRGEVASLALPLSPVGEVSGRPHRFAWRAVAGAESYRVELFTPDLSTVWESVSVTAPEAILPDEVSVRLAPGSEYLWRVVVHLPDRPPLVSETAGFRVR